MLVGQITPHHVSICTLEAFASVGTDTLATQMQATPWRPSTADAMVATEPYH